MGAARKLQFYSIILLFLTTFTAAWPWPQWLPAMDTLIVRADPPASTPAASQTDSSSPQSTGDQNSPTNSGSASPTQTGTNSGTVTAGPTSSPSDNSNSTIPTHTDYDPLDRPGGVSLIQPAITAGPQYYKIGDWVTFAWNYTSLLGSPTAVNVVATCTTNSQLYTIASNQTVANATNTVFWDTGSYQSTALSAPLVMATYTLIIYDVDGGISATPEPGYLAVYNQYTFGMYLPEAYSDPPAGYKCATCSGALSDMERRALGMVLGMGLLTVLSFTWFVTGLNVIW